MTILDPQLQHTRKEATTIGPRAIWQKGKRPKPNVLAQRASPFPRADGKLGFITQRGGARIYLFRDISLRELSASKAGPDEREMARSDGKITLGSRHQKQHGGANAVKVGQAVRALWGSGQ